MNSFLEKIKEVESRLNFTLPIDYINFIEPYLGQATGFGYWFDLNELALAIEYDIPNFLIIEECPHLISEEDCNYLLPILADNDAYIVMDLRVATESKGVFMLWSDECELGFQSATFTEFIEKLKNKVAKGHEEYNYFDL
jgi:hypothetical protein